MPIDKSISENRSTRILYKYVAVISAVVILTTTAYGLIEATRQYLAGDLITIGETLVTVGFPFPFFAKPVTYLSISSVVGWFALIQLNQKRIHQMAKLRRSVLSILAAALVFASFYEMAYNFIVWNALITADAISGQIRIDLLNINYPIPSIPWNLVFATKMFAALFAISLYSFIVLQSVDWRQQPKLRSR
uniref:Uncharacterized protein n=1 Tax=uncultured marine thaumarchaeote KM3_74_C10 TaxID=1456270 RepID=A0A075HKR3_9ARCH|nr:hypothetical protein [uncultured marine thaumarchaeote KM3_74_C10]